MKTAVEWLIDEIDMQYPDINIKRKEWMIDKAKEMEEEQIMKSLNNKTNDTKRESTRTI
jgi:hypothetical protein